MISIAALSTSEDWLQPTDINVQSERALVKKKKNLAKARFFCFLISLASANGNAKNS